MTRLPGALASLAAVLVLAAVAGCGGGSEHEPAPDVAGEATPEVAIDDFEFMPADFSVQAGEEVTVTNEDTAAHTLSADDGGFDTGAIQADGDRGTFTVEEPGTYPFICEFHPTMTGTLTAE